MLYAQQKLHLRKSIIGLSDIRKCLTNISFLKQEIKNLSSKEGIASAVLFREILQGRGGGGG